MNKKILQTIRFPDSMVLELIARLTPYEKNKKGAMRAVLIP